MKVRYILLLLLPTTLLSSCVRDEFMPCPPLQINLTVKDKNYFNVDKVDMEQRVDENLAFREYVPTLHYMLRDAATEQVVAERSLFDVEGDEKDFAITFPEELPHGRYILTVWGGMDGTTPLAGNRLSVAFHPGMAEGMDIYMANDTLIYDAGNFAYTLGMERTKGKLVIQGVDLPEGLRLSKKTVGGLCGRVDSNFRYADESTVYTETRWNSPKELVTKTLLAPSVKKDGSLLAVSLHGADGEDFNTLVPADVKITVKRNELTVLRYVYQPTGDFSIYILVNGNWEVVHGMEID